MTEQEAIEESGLFLSIFQYKKPECCICKKEIENGICATDPRNKERCIHSYCLMYAMSKGAFEDPEMNLLVEEYLKESND